MEHVLLFFFLQLVATFLGLPRLLSGKESACNAGDTGDSGLIPGWGISPRGRARPRTPLFLPGESHGEEHSGLQSIGSQADMTESTEHTHTQPLFWNTHL